VTCAGAIGARTHVVYTTMATPQVDIRPRTGLGLAVGMTVAVVVIFAGLMWPSASYRDRHVVLQPTTFERCDRACEARCPAETPDSDDHVMCEASCVLACSPEVSGTR
jgi:hypothetical protein